MERLEISLVLAPVLYLSPLKRVPVATRTYTSVTVTIFYMGENGGTRYDMTDTTFLY